MEPRSEGQAPAFAAGREKAPGKPPTTKPEDQTGRRDEELDRVEEAGDESFPASDPPSWTPTHVGPGDDEEEDGGKT
jgi:hypothetical protein